MTLPSLRVVLLAPEWLVVTMLVCLITAALFRVGLDLYLANVKIEDYEKVVDDADKGARGVERHEELLAALKAEIAALTARPRPAPGPRLDTRPALAVLADQADEWRKQFNFSEEGRR